MPSTAILFLEAIFASQPAQVAADLLADRCPAGPQEHASFVRLGELDDRAEKPKALRARLV